MKQFKSYKFRLYPTYQQEVFFRLHSEACRWVYNFFLDKKINLYKTTKQSTSKRDDTKDLTVLKNSKALKPWLSKVNAQSLQGAVFNLDRAFQNFFKKTADFPKFKNKTDTLSFTFSQNFKIKNGFLYLPKAIKSPIKMIMDRPLPKKILNCTISKTPFAVKTKLIACP